MGQWLGCEFRLRLLVSQPALPLGGHISQDKLVNHWACFLIFKMGFTIISILYRVLLELSSLVGILVECLKYYLAQPGLLF